MLQLHAGPDLGGGGLPPTWGLPPNPSIFLANDRCLPCYSNKGLLKSMSYFKAHQILFQLGGLRAVPQTPSGDLTALFRSWRFSGGLLLRRPQAAHQLNPALAI